MLLTSSLPPAPPNLSAFNRHMERPGGPTPPVAAGGSAVLPVSDDAGQGSRGRGGGGGGGAGGLVESLYDAADDSCRPSQVPASAKRAATSPSLVNSWLFNVARESAPPAAGPGPVACAYGDGIGVAPSSLPRELAGVGGPAVLFPLMQRAQTEPALCWTLGLIRRAVRGGGASSLAYMQSGGGYLVLAGLLRSRRALLGPDTVRACFEMAVDRAYDGCASVGGGGGGGGGGGPNAGGVAGDDGGGGDGADEDKPWGGADTGYGGDAEERQASAWGWERGLAFVSREEVGLLLRKAGVEGDGASGDDDGASDRRGGVEPATGGAVGGQHGARGLCPFVLLTDAYALKYLVMNHQVRFVGYKGFVGDNPGGIFVGSRRRRDGLAVGVMVEVEYTETVNGVAVSGSIAAVQTGI